MTKPGSGGLAKWEHMRTFLGASRLGGPIPFHHLTPSSTGEQAATWRVEELTI